MNRILALSLMALAMLCVIAPSATAQTDPGAAHAEGVARSALSGCVGAAHGGFEVTYSTVLVGECPGSGYYNVNVYGAPRCKPGEICPLFIVLIARATVDCDFNLIDSECRFGQ